MNSLERAKESLFGLQFSVPEEECGRLNEGQRILLEITLEKFRTVNNYMAANANLNSLPAEEPNSEKGEEDIIFNPGTCSI